MGQRFVWMSMVLPAPCFPLPSSACNCNRHGSVGNSCDARTGQCQCKAKYVGRTCSQCEVKMAVSLFMHKRGAHICFLQDGFGNLEAGCRQCRCNPTGSRSDVCDAESGQCDCKPGVDGLTCNECKLNFYGFSSAGCTGKVLPLLLNGRMW